MLTNFKNEKMKKLSILLLAVFYIGIANLKAQTDVNTETTTIVEEVKDAKKCIKNDKICDKTCGKKMNGTCCKGKKVKESTINFKSSNNYSGKSSCSKDTKKSCCKKKAKKCGGDCTKPCCVPTPAVTEDMTTDKDSSSSKK